MQAYCCNIKHRYSSEEDITPFYESSDALIKIFSNIFEEYPNLGKSSSNETINDIRFDIEEWNVYEEDGNIIPVSYVGRYKSICSNMNKDCDSFKPYEDVFKEIIERDDIKGEFEDVLEHLVYSIGDNVINNNHRRALKKIWK